MPRIMLGLHPGSEEVINGKIVQSASPVIDFRMNGNMLLIFFLSLAAFTILYFWMWSLGYKSLIYKDRIQKQISRG
jgi:heme exporter protein C